MKPNEMKANSKLASAFLKGLANETRLLILCQLVEGEKNVTELEQQIGVRQPTLSQQLARLRRDGFVSTRRDSKCIYYSIANQNAERVIGLLYDLYCGPEASLPISDEEITEELMRVTAQ